MNSKRASRSLRWIVCLFLLPILVGVFSLARAEVIVDIDKTTLNDLLTALSAEEFTVELMQNQTVTVRLDDLQVTGLEPTSDGNHRGYIRTRMRLKVPDIGLDVPLTPRVALDVAEKNGQRLIELRFDKVEIPMPLSGPLDVARFLPPLRFPAENLWAVAGARGDARVHSKLREVRMLSEAVRFRFDVIVTPPEGSGAGSAP